MRCFLSFYRFRSGRLNKQRRAITAVEMSLLAPTFFFFLIGTTEIMMIETAQALMENATYNATRLAKTNNTNGQKDINTAVNQVLINELQSFGTMIDTTRLTTTSSSYTSFSGSAAGGGTSGYGTSQQIVVFDITYPWIIFTPMMGQLIGHQDAYGHWVINLTSHMVVRNEPY